MAKRSGILLLVCGTALLALTAYWLLFTMFMPYDDEGYVLISLKNYTANGGLYSRVFSQYGPFFYLIHDWGHRLLGYEFSNTTGRLMTLGCWMVAVCASAHLVWRQTRSIVLTGYTLALTFVYLRLMVHEPSHPGGLIAVLVALGAWSGTVLINRRATPGLAVSAGLIGAALLLTKINVGIFFLMAAGIWFVIHLREFNQARLAGFGSAVLLVILPLALMQAALGEKWGRIFAGLSIVVSLTTLSVAWRDRHPLTTWSDARWGGGAMLVLGLIVVGTVCLRGTTLLQMMDGVLLGPLRHPGVYHFPPNWRPGAAIGGGVSLLLALLVLNSQASWLRWLLIGLRIILAVAIGLVSAEWLPFTSHSSVMSYVMPLSWIFVLRLSPDPDGENHGVTSWVGLLLALQFLHAYPVAGTQIAWGTFLIIPLMALGLHDTQRFTSQRARTAMSSAIGVGCLALALVSTGRLCLQGWRFYTESHPLGLPGAEDVRPPEDLARNLRLLSLNAAAHGDMLFSIPGMFSFNNWADLPTPTLGNTTHWFSLLDEKQQAETITALEGSKRPVLIINQGLLDFLEDHHFVITGPLYRYLRQNYECAFKLKYYEFWVRRGRVVVPLGSAELRQLKIEQPGLAPNKLELIVALPAGRKIARIELVRVQGEPRTLRYWDKNSGPLFCTSITLQGAARSAETNSGWEQTLPPLTRLSLPLDKPLVVNRDFTAIYLRDANGMLLAEARFMD